MNGTEHHVLLLEDCPADAELIEHELRREGLALRVRRVATEAEYADALRDPELALVLSDHALPGYDGQAALALARRERPEVPFIFVSGTLGEEAAIDALREGATDYVLKHRLARLRPAVRRALTEADGRERLRSTQAQLSLQQERLEAFLGAAPVGMAILDRELRFVLVNEALAMINGRPAAAHVGRSVREVIPSVAPQAEPLLAKVLATGETVRNAELTGTSAAHGGAVRNWLATYFPLPGPDGRPAGVGAVVIGVTEMKRTQAALVESEKRFRSLVNAMEDGVFILDRDERLVEAYGNFPDAAAHAGKPWTEVHGTAAVELHRDAAHRALAGEPVIYEWTLDGPRERRWFQTRLSPIRDEAGEITGVLGVGRDLTDLKKMQAGLDATERMATVGLLAAGVAHEINNPLAVIAANLEIAAQEAGRAADGAGARGGGRLAEVIADAREAAERVRDIVRDLKVFSRAEDEVPPMIVRAEQVLESAARLAWNEIRHRARLVKDLGAIPPVRANQSRLGQVFLNLLVNAAQSIPEGHADTNEIRLVTRTGERGEAVIEIADTGQGMTPEVLGRLFTPFFTTKAVGIGTGLGLSICQRIVDSLGGRIAVESAPGRGSTFRVVLPPASAPAEAPPPRPAPPVEAAPPRRGNVLVVDDEPTICKTVSRILSREHEVVTMTRATDAIGALADGRRFDVILCDLLMPQASGMDVYEAIVGIAPDQARRMVFLTGGAFTTGAQSFLEQVPNTRLEKPFDPDRLREIVNAHVR